jgi:hypothetical protein
MLHRVRRPRAVLALALATLAAACGSDSSTAPNVRPVTMDQALAELSTPAVSSMAAALAPGTPTLPALASSRCAYQAATQSFACTPIVATGLTVTQSFTLLDGSGAPQSAFDQATTSAVRAKTSVAGTLQNGTDQFTIDGQQELTLSGLRTATHTLDGTSTMHVVSVGSLNAETTARVTIAGLELQAPTAEGTHPWPTAGTIVAEISTSFTGAPLGAVVATATFNGTSTVTVKFSIPGGAVVGTCTIDLANNASSCQ